MVGPKHAKSQGSTRTYTHPTRNVTYYSVTTILNALSKPALPYWAAAETAVAALAHRDLLRQMEESEGTEAAIDWLKGAPWRKSKKARDLGSAIHGATEAYVLGGPQPDVAPEVAPFLRHYLDFLDDWRPEIELVETTVWNHTQAYAGTLDAVMRLEGMALVMDTKTTAEPKPDRKSKPPYPEAAMQVAAYRYAEVLTLANGDEQEMPPTDGGAVLVLWPDHYDLVPVRCDEEVFRAFLFVREAFRWQEELAKTVIGDPVVPSGVAEVLGA
jgi:hypothetical protein